MTIKARSSLAFFLVLDYFPEEVDRTLVSRSNTCLYCHSRILATASAASSVVEA
jgi:nitrate reductase cytochrome c-type subunit